MLHKKIVFSINSHTEKSPQDQSSLAIWFMADQI